MIPHPKFSTNILAHNKIINELISLYNKNKLHHAYIFKGIKGIGKASLAYVFTKQILGSNNLETNSINLIENNNHPNLLVIEPEFDEKIQQYKNNISIEQTRTIKPFLNLSSLSYSNYPKIVIIDSIDNLNLNAANSILKLLEEPSNNRIFLLISHNLSNILPTINSRCNIIHFNPLKFEEIIKIIQSLNIKLSLSYDELKKLYKEGSLQEILWFLNKDNLILYNLIQDIIKNKDFKKIPTLGEKVKNLTSYNFKYLIELLIKENNYTKFNLNSNNYKIKNLLIQDQLFNLDKSAIITSYIIETLY